MEIIKEDFKHSFSSVTKFSKSPCEWLCTYGLKLRSPSNASMTRGNLSEFGAYYKIKRGMQQRDDKGFAKLIDILGPFGNKNSIPIFLIQDVKFVQKKLIKNQ